MHLEAEMKLNDHITSYRNLVNDISGEVKLITKGLAKKLINEQSILNGAKYFVESQNHLIFQSVFNYFKTHANDDIVMAWKSKSLPDVSVKSSCYIRK